ncbi:MAG: hypothetical protein LQ346_007398 [Caloplaca aetnensis]|nr:MAG: hypothetical protein LQ346_007398 [Caloplaca aetnensis]
MATTYANSGQPAAVEGTNGMLRNNDDPFTNTPTMHPSRTHRYSSFDTRLFTDNHPSSSPNHAKKALESHLAETERRLQEASKLGTTLVEQRQKISARLREVESQQHEGELAPELRQRLRDIEKEYNEVGRESARAFLGPKTDATSDSETPFALDGRKPASPAKFSSQATDSPSKLNVPRKQRNQSANQIHDIELAAQISTSLLSQVRQLQGMLSEKDEALKTAELERSRLEQDADGFAQRLRSLDESEQRYKDENWSLETQLHELSAEQKEAAGREHKIQQALMAATSEKNATLRELDDLKQTHVKVIDDHAILRKNQDSELGSLRRDLSNGESERAALQRKVEELAAQNQELARAFAGRFREDGPEQSTELGSDPEMNPPDRSDTDHSPPPSPTKGSRRHSMLESETLKSSLHHAHRMIQNLKSNVHREKTEKLELKRMLQEARDELDVRRIGGPDHKRLKSKANQEPAKREVRPNMLGAGRNSRTDIMVDEPDWEDNSTDNSPRPIRALPRRMESTDPSLSTDASDAYQTANETEDGFETANERDYPTENEAVTPGANEAAEASSDDMTETEELVARGGTIRGKRPSAMISSRAEGRASFSSTASISADEGETAFMTPNQAQPQKYRIKVNRGNRKSRLASEGLESNPSTAKGSPASFISPGGQGDQSLFAELGDINGAESSDDGTPSRTLISQRSSASMRRAVGAERSSSKRRRSVSSQRSSRSTRPTTSLSSGIEPPVPRLPVVDSGTMTEPWQPVRPEQPERPGQSAADLDVPEAFAYETPSKLVPSGAMIAGTGPVASTPQSETPEGPMGTDRAFDSPSTAQSTPLRTTWDQPLSMFSNIIPTFGSASNTTPLSTKSAASRDMPKDLNLRSRGSSVDPSASANEGEPRTPERQRHMQAQPGSHIDQPELSLSPIQGIDTAPLQPLNEPIDKQATSQETPDEHGMTYPGQLDATTSIDSTIPLQRMPSPDIHGKVLPLSSQEVEEAASTTREPTARLGQGATGRILGSIFGSSQQQQLSVPRIAEDHTDESPVILPSVEEDINGRALRELSPTATQRGLSQTHQSLEYIKPAPIDTADHSAQTLLSAEQIDRMIKQREAADYPRPSPVPVLKPLSAIGATSPSSGQKFQDPMDFNRGKAFEYPGKEASPLAKGIRRPTSATSIRLSNSTGSHPPLPPDHQQAIAAASQRTSSTEPPNVMGPPLAPASAYRANSMRPRTPTRVRTPSEQRSSATPASRVSTTPRARTMRSRMSRRSSVSSFESELDERFNIRLDGMPMPDDGDNGTDPRMIQAITQTMIGEFLWKYTRKAGRGEMSSNRHRRFFWIHPYTRTLYWSDRDPSTAGRAEMKAKSVAIEAVHVVADDNPMPPGLHRKSLIIVTPGRSVKFTAQTSQRHETWFNALSYLLLRTGPEGSDNPHLTAEELAEFNPAAHGNRSLSRTGRSRISLASFRSRGKTPEPPPQARSQSRHSTRLPAGAPVSAESDTEPPQPQTAEKRSRRNSASLGSRISAYWRPTRGGSVSSRYSQQSNATAATAAAPSSSPTRRDQPASSANTAGVYRPTSSQAGSLRGGSESSFTLEPRGAAGGRPLENVRSCCDGKHDVGSLSHSHGQRQGRYGSQSHEGRSSQSVRSERGGGVGGIGFE